MFTGVRVGHREHGHVHMCARVALLIQHVTPMRHDVLPFVPSLAVPLFSTLSRKRHDFRKKVTFLF